MTEPASGESRSRAFLPATGIPLLYFGFAHVCLTLALTLILVRPDLPGEFFHHPRMVAIVHLVTLGWISGSILGAFYIAGPLALRVPMRSGWGDRAAFTSFALGVAGMVASFWYGRYDAVIWVALFVAAAIVHVAVRAWMGLWRAPIAWPVKLHVSLAFANMIMASGFGVLVAWNRVAAVAPWPPMAAAFAHAHLAGVGWAVMMVVGMAYRLIPMILPAEMPKGRRMAVSAVLLEIGTLALVLALLAGSAWTVAAALLIVAGLGSFIAEIMKTVRRRLPPPRALPRPDWATWQTHVAFVWLLIAVCAGITLTLPMPFERLLALGWLYGIAGLVGFLAQIVVGIQGRLLPLYGWYREMELGDMRPPERSAHSLASQDLARAILVAWTLGVPLLLCGLAAAIRPLTAAGSMFLLAGVILNVTQIATILSPGPTERRRT
ncbi:MAG TPA: hypothetical protein VFJ02_01785 [Vicinamibacterales bacterium]|nr:hypothetical protein [Vicinamibacterales bacterium]